MSNAIVEGFGLYGTDNTALIQARMTEGVWAQSGTGPATSPLTQCIGQLPWDPTNPDLYYATQATTSNDILRRVLPSTTDPCTASFYFAADALPSVQNLMVFSFRNGSNAVVASIQVDTTGVIKIYDSGPTLLVSSSGPVIAAKTPVHVEAKIGVAAGTFELRINGSTTPVINGTGLTFASTGNIAQITLGGIGGQGNYPNMYFAHLIVRDTAGTVNTGFAGERKVATILPASDNVAHQGWAAQSRQRFGNGVLNNTGDGYAITAGLNVYTYASGTGTKHNLGTGDFTIEGNVRFSAFPTGNTYATLFGRWSAYSNVASYALRVGSASYNGGKTTFIVSTSGTLSGATTLISAPVPWTLNEWHHIAVVRSSGVTTMYFDGVAQNAGVADTNAYAAVSTNTSIGNEYLSLSTSTQPACAFFDEVRLTVGYARYTGNFTPPSAAFPRGSNDPQWAKVGLLCGFETAIADDSSNALTMAVQGSSGTYFPYQMTPNDGSFAYQTIAETTPLDDNLIEASQLQATATLAQSAVPSANETVTVGTKDGSTAAVYTWQSSVSSAFDVLIGSSVDDSLANLVAAINAGAGAGTKYGTGTTANYDVTGAQTGTGAATVTAIIPGTAGNSIACSTTDAAGVWTGSTLAGGANIPSYSMFGMSRPPVATTVVDSVTFQTRLYKSDSGSATVQASFVGASGGVLAGAANAIGTSPSYVIDTFEADPDGNALTPAVVANAFFKFNRTA